MEQVERVVVAFGGSVVAPPELDVAALRALGAHLEQWAAHRQLFVVIGGGAPARRYIRAARELGVAEDDLDRIGIMATRLNAQLVDSLVRGEKGRQVPTTTAEAAARADAGTRIVVMGGTTAGHSTDQVAAELAVAAGAARLVVATNVDGVYTADPKVDATAQRLERLDYARLLDIIGDPTWKAAGSPGVIDGPASLLVARHAMPTMVVHGGDLDNVGAAVAGRDFRGTVISGSPVARA